MADTSLQTSQPRQIERAETFAPRSLNEAFQFADMVLVSGMAPKSYRDLIAKTKDGSDVARAAVVVALQFGLEVGFQPMQALQCIANINGNPSVWGDGALALVQSSGLLEWIREDDFETIKANKKATCIVKRRGDPEEKKITFSYDDAITAGIFGNAVWKTYPYRMCMFRARGFALRDKFPDVLKGLKIAEEVMDYIDAEPEPERARIQATIVVPVAETVNATAEAKPAVTEVKAETQVDQDAVITVDEAKMFYDAYKKSGKVAEDVVTFGKGYEPNISNSRQIKRKDYAAFMAWANTPKGEVLQPWTGTLPLDENPDAEPA